jgi:sulfate adenylyltransferase
MSANSTDAGTLSGVSSAARPQWTPDSRELDDLELLGMGLLAPHTGFGRPDGNHAVLTLTVDASIAEQALAAGTLDLLDPEGLTLATVSVTDTYPIDDQTAGVVADVGDVEAREHGPFRRYHLPPPSLHAYDPAATTAVVVRRPLTTRDLEDIREAAQGRRVLLLAFAGTGSPQGVTAPALVRSALAAAKALDAAVVAVSAADHGDPVTDDFVERSVATSYASETLRLGTPRGELPADIAGIVARDQPPPEDRGLVLFFTGLSGSGKSTLARAVLDELLERGDRTVTSLDGDVVRHLLSRGLGFSREDRETNIVRIGFVASEIARHGGVAICSPIAPFAATRARVRAMTGQVGGEFVLIYVSTPLEECERRDRKGLYARARAGLIPDFTGISSPYEEPSDAHLVIDTSNRTIADCADEIMAYLTEQGWLSRDPSPHGNDEQ